MAESDGKLSDGMLRDQQKLEQGKPPLEQRDTGTQSAADVTDEMAEEHVRELIVEKLAEALNVDISMIDVHESFADYGLDSILGVNFVQDVNQGLGIHLQTTDIFDYSSVKQLTLYILGQFGDIVLPVLGHYADPIEDGKDTSRETQAPKEKEYMFNPVQTASASIEPERPKQENTGKSLAQREPIAIIGMSGRFAGSDNVDELWNHLKNGDDLVKEVTRWDLSKYQEKIRVTAIMEAFWRILISSIRFFQYFRTGSNLHGSAAAVVSRGSMACSRGCGLCGCRDGWASVRSLCRLCRRRLPAIAG